MLGFWDWIRRKKENDEPEIKNVRQIGDIKISVVTGLSNTRDVKISAWNSEMAYELFQLVWAQLDEEKNDGF